MAAFKCKNCGGNLIPVPGETGRAVCDSCLCASIIPSITDERRTDQHNRGIDFRRARKFEEALQEFGSIVRDNPKDAEAHWDMMLSRYGINYEKDYRSGDYIPTCDRLSEVSVFDDPDYKAAIQYAKPGDKTWYQEQAEHIEKIRLGMIALAARAEAYDVFICFKDTNDETGKRTPDSFAAQDIYLFLKNRGYRVFFSRVTLKQEHLGEEWEPVIYAALNTARLMLVVGTSKENLEAPWVKNEWTRFLAVRAKDMTKSLITCYQGMDIKDLPPELKALQAHNIMDEESTFYKNLAYTVDAHCSKNETKVQVTQQKSASNYAKRSLQFLEDGEWTKADKMLEEALDLDPENGEAHVGKLLLNRKCHTVEELQNQQKALSGTGYYTRVMKYGSPERKNQIMAIDQIIKERLEQQSREKSYADYVDRFDNLETSEEAKILTQDFVRMGTYKEAAKYADRCRERYRKFLAEEQAAEEKRKAEEAAEEQRRAEAAEKEARRKAAEEEEARRLEALAKRKAKRKKHRKIARNIALLLVVLGAVGYFAFGKKYIAAVDAYALAQEYEAQGDYRNATEQYYIAAKANYKDSEERGLEVCRLWLGWEPVMLSTDEYPWWGVDADGGLTFDYDVYDASVEFQLPTILDGELVTGISESCFGYNEGIKALNLPVNYTWIGDYAFGGCTNLVTISMQGVERIGHSAFTDCDSLTFFEVPATCVSIGEYAFRDCDYLNSVVLNEGLVDIQTEAFASCESLASITIPSTVEVLGARAFSDCYSLSSAVLNGVKEIGESAFYNCSALTSVTLGEGLATIGDYAFYEAGISGNLNIPTGVTYIGAEAFYSCDNLYEVYVAETEGLTVGANCFYGCPGLNGASFASGLVTLGDGAFDYCEAMTWVSLPEGLTYIGNWCFSNDALYEIKLPSTLTTIGEGAFNNCNNLQGVHVPGGVSVIETRTFTDCDSLWYLWFDEGITLIRDDAVYGTGLTNVCYSGSAESWANVSVGNNELIINANLFPDYTGS